MVVVVVVVVVVSGEVTGSDWLAGVSWDRESERQCCANPIPVYPKPTTLFRQPITSHPLTTYHVNSR
ncbi:hypothetical protein E2C01_076760 [Portunus trituberculatus]|uniref:Secreted protein n=1 Tax=Portunus trituberculatus TaxID=210409 RepID=A0A5B7IIL4_PORTR|nr:hypothetical protein [Portunus trituberculatus]